MGGAQAIAALAYGTETVEPVDVIVGPGAAVRAGGQAPGARASWASTASPGPADLVIIATEPPRPRCVLDALAQAEHGAGSVVAVLSPDPGLLDRLEDAGEALIARSRPTWRPRWRSARASRPSTSSCGRGGGGAGAARSARPAAVFVGAGRGHRVRGLRRGLEPRPAHGGRRALRLRAQRAPLPARHERGPRSRRRRPRRWPARASRSPAPRASARMPPPWPREWTRHMTRTADITRTTGETDVRLSLDLDGTGGGPPEHRRRLPGPHARPAGPPRQARPRRADVHGRPADGLAPHGRGHRDRARPGAGPRARRPRRASAATATP